MTASPLFVVSPHLDDAAFGCGVLLASHPGATVCTVFAGAPPVPLSTSWDRRAGFPHSDAALEARAREDEHALAVLGARGVHLDFLDSQYETPQSKEAAAQALLEAWQAAGRPLLLAPLGLFHSDHVLVSDACCALLARGDLPSLLFYEDALYRRIAGEFGRRSEQLAARGFRLDPAVQETLAPVRQPRAAAQKWRSVRAYRSQLRAFGDAYPNDLVEPERYWRVSSGNNGRAYRSHAVRH